MRCSAGGKNASWIQSSPWSFGAGNSLRVSTYLINAGGLRKLAANLRKLWRCLISIDGGKGGGLVWSCSTKDFRCMMCGWKSELSV